MGGDVTPSVNDGLSPPLEAGGATVEDQLREQYRSLPAAPEPETPHAPRPMRPTPLQGLNRVLGEALTQTGEMVTMAGAVVGSVARRPAGIWTDVKDQMSDILKLCWFPLIVSVFGFGFGAPGLQALNIYKVFGIPERLGSFFVMASVRELAGWITAMVVAGVVGTAITADLGARRVREEIDAMQVLGVDPHRTLVVPRVIALTVMTSALVLTGIVIGVVGGYAAAVVVGTAGAGPYVAAFSANANVVDLAATTFKAAGFGAIIGVVSCYKGLKAQGGPIGVGRAVNQSVVIAFAAIWIFNYVFTTIILGLYPEIQVFK